MTFWEALVKLSIHRKKVPGYRGTILSGRLSISIISLLAAELLNPRFQTPTLLGNPLTIIVVGVVQKKVKVRL